MMKQSERKTDSNWQKAIGAIAKAIESGRLTRGELAGLRRLKPEDPTSEAFWHALTHFIEAHDPPPIKEEARIKWEQRWAVILNGMARLSHDGHRLFGRALAEAGFHELRLRRLLRAQGQRLWDELRAAVQFLASKGDRINWFDAAALILADPEIAPEWAYQVRRRIARQFFSVQQNV